MHEDDREPPIYLHVPKGLFDPPDRPLTAEEKAHPTTFFGVTQEMRKERLDVMGYVPPPLSQEEKDDRRASTAQLRQLETREITRDVRDPRPPISFAPLMEGRPQQPSRGDYWAARGKEDAAKHEPMKHFAKARDQEQERDR